jgi:hypothetical protein
MILLMKFTEIVTGGERGAQGSHAWGVATRCGLASYFADLQHTRAKYGVFLQRNSGLDLSD